MQLTCVLINEQVTTALGIRISSLTFSTDRPSVVFGPTVISSFPCSPLLSDKLCLT